MYILLLYGFWIFVLVFVEDILFMHLQKCLFIFSACDPGTQNQS